MHTSRSGGYAGLIALLITCLIIGFLFWRSDIFSGTKGAPSIQQDLGAIKSAEQTKQKLESQYNQQMKEIGN